MHKDKRNIEKRKIGMRNDDSDNKNDNDISNLTCKELRDICWLHALPRGGVKSIQITRITNYLHTVALWTVDDKEMIFKNIIEDSIDFTC